ncbi:MAG TPA: SdrD B-like domain-containing protein, partial [Saprospiraceae bacterium]|nr:SdrD B-like domain-containing protein [Saprospiraceae bacterium]
NENGINDITLHLIEESTGTIIRTLQSKMDANNNPGFYEFKYVPLGQYYVEVQLPDTLCVTKFNEGTDTTKD